MAKSIIYDTSAKEKILAGVSKLEKAVAVTLGPRGKNVIIDEYGSIHSTRDGVTVAKSVTLKDRFENIGANAVREVAEKSNEKVGDGTTTSTILAASIYKNGLRYVSFGANSTLVKNGISKAADKAVELIRGMSTGISTKEEIRRVAVVSANGDDKIGDIISDVMDKIGPDGTIKVENGNGVDLTSKIMKGMVIDQSYESPYMVTNPETMEAELDNPFVLIVDHKLSAIKDMVPCLQAIAQTSRPLLIIAESYADDILASLIMTRLRGSGLTSVAVKAPSYGDNRSAILEDIAILCGGRVVSDKTGTKIVNALPESGILGEAERVVINKNNTVIIGGRGDKAAVDSRASSLRTQIDDDSSDEYSKNQLRERLAKLTSGIGIISVGARTEAERKELRDRVDDAFCASKAAVREGIVPGGGAALLSVAGKISEFAASLDGDEKIGAVILAESLSAPAKKIVENAGLDASYVVNKIVESKDISNCGFNVLTGKYADMMADGVIDPTEVVVNEVQNAASVASLLLMTEALIVDEPEQDGNKQQMSMQPMM